MGRAGHLSPPRRRHLQQAFAQASSTAAIIASTSARATEWTARAPAAAVGVRDRPRWTCSPAASLAERSAKSSSARQLAQARRPSFGNDQHQLSAPRNLHFKLGTFAIRGVLAHRGGRGSRPRSTSSARKGAAGSKTKASCWRCTRRCIARCGRDLGYDCRLTLTSSCRTRHAMFDARSSPSCFLDDRQRRSRRGSAACAVAQTSASAEQAVQPRHAALVGDVARGRWLHPARSCPAAAPAPSAIADLQAGHRQTGPRHRRGSFD